MQLGNKEQKKICSFLLIPDVSVEKFTRCRRSQEEEEKEDSSLRRRKDHLSSSLLRRHPCTKLPPPARLLGSEREERTLIMGEGEERGSLDSCVNFPPSLLIYIPKGQQKRGRGGRTVGSPASSSRLACLLAVL